MFAALLLLGLLLPLAGMGGDGSDDGGQDDQDSQDDDGVQNAAPADVVPDTGGDAPSPGDPLDDDDPFDALEDPPAEDFALDNPPPVAAPSAPEDAVLSSYRSGPPGGFNIDVDFKGDWTPDAQQAVIAAADYLSRVVLEDLRDVPGAEGADDLRIEASITALDGRGGLLGQGGVTLVRTENALPVRGVMIFDSADVATYLDNGLWQAVVLHEMMHTMGVGTLWDYQGQITGNEASGDLRFTGANATHVYKTEMSEISGRDPGAARGVPIETDGGEGTARGHWDEQIFETELMTGWTTDSAYLSTMTLASLEDLGFDTFFDDITDPNDRTAPRPVDPVARAGLRAA